MIGTNLIMIYETLIMRTITLLIITENKKALTPSKMVHYLKDRMSVKVFKWLILVNEKNRNYNEVLYPIKTMYSLKHFLSTLFRVTSCLILLELRCLAFYIILL